MRFITIIILFSLSFIKINSQNIPDGPVAFYPFNGDANDISGFEHNGLPSDQVYFYEDRFGNPNSSVYLNSDGSYINVPFGYQFGSEISISFWMKYEDWGPNNSTAILHRRIGNNIDFDISISPGSSERNIAFHIGNWSEFGPNVNYEDQWIHYVMVYDGQTVKYYQNTQITEEFDASNNGPITTNNDLMVIGQYSGSNSLQGQIDDLGIWDRALTIDEINELYIGEFQTDCVPDGPVAFYPFNGDANDISGFEHNGLPSDQVYFYEDRFGNPNSSVYLNSDGSYINVPFGYQFGSEISISFWMKYEDWGPNNSTAILHRRIGNNIDFDISISPGSSERNIAFHIGNWSEFGPNVNYEDQWIHYVMVYDGQTVKYYQNTQITEEFDASNNGPITTNNDLMVIGQYSGSNSLQGQIDDLGIWDRALTIDEINELYIGNCDNLSIEEQNTNRIKIYPNPTSDYIFLVNNDELEAIVFDLLGKELIRENISSRLDIRTLEKGTYILNLKDGVNTSTHKIIKE